MLVELDVFSGRPNPHWQLDEQHREELLRLQGHLTPASQTAPEPPGLGYRGFVYSDRGGQVRAYRGHVVTARGMLEDPTFTIERYLLEHTPAEYREVARRVATELEIK